MSNTNEIIKKYPYLNQPDMKGMYGFLQHALRPVSVLSVVAVFL